MSVDQRADRLAFAAVLLDGVGAAVGRRHALTGEPFGIALPVAVGLAARRDANVVRRRFSPERLAHEVA